MPFRRTQGILSDVTDPVTDADVIMTAAILGFAADYLQTEKKPIRFDMDPRDAPFGPAPTGNAQSDEQKKYADKQKKFAEFILAIEKMGRVLFRSVPNVAIQQGFTPDNATGGVIMGVYKLAGQMPPQNLLAPELSPGAMSLYEQIKGLHVPQYVGRGAYTGFVDNPVLDEYGRLKVPYPESPPAPIGPLSTIRLKAPAPGTIQPDPHPRWLPPFEINRSNLWTKRRRKGNVEPRYGLTENDRYVPWGLIGGNDAGEKPDEKPDYTPPQGFEKNKADQTTASMFVSGMRFEDAPWLLERHELFNDEVWGYSSDYIATYTHGMIQAIYKAYHLGPQCVPYEIAVGGQTTKLASCIPCTLFMYAVGYPPTSIHLGKGESWAPLYQPHSQPGYQPTGIVAESQVIRDLNNRWYESCYKWLKLGLTMLTDDVISDRDPQKGYPYRRSRDSLLSYLDSKVRDTTVAGVLILDAITIHDSEQTRIDRTLK